MISIIMGYNEVGLGSGQEQSEAEARGRARWKWGKPSYHSVPDFDGIYIYLSLHQDQLEAEVEEDIEVVDKPSTFCCKASLINVHLRNKCSTIYRWLKWKKKVKKRRKTLPQSQSQPCRTSQLFWRVPSTWYVVKLWFWWWWCWWWSWEVLEGACVGK